MNEKNNSMPEMSGINDVSIIHYLTGKEKRGNDLIICEPFRIVSKDFLICFAETILSDQERPLEPDIFEEQLIKGSQDFYDSQKRCMLAFFSLLQNTKKCDLRFKEVDVHM